MTPLTRWRQHFLWLMEPLHLFILSLACLPIAFTALYMGIHDDNLPRFDEQRNLRIAIAIEDGTFSLDDIFYSAAGHYTIPTNLITALLVKTTHWNLNYGMWLNLVLALITFALFLLLAYQTGVPPFYFVLPLAMLLFAPMQDISWLVFYQSAWRFADMFLLAALCLIACMPKNRWSLIGAALLALFATFSIGSGFLSWGVLIAALWLNGERRWRVLALWIMLALAVTGYYIYLSRINVSTSDEEITAETVSIANPLEYLRFMLTYLGNNFGRTVNLAFFFGLMGVVLLGLNSWALRQQSRLLAIWLPLAGYAAATGLLVGVSRLTSRGMIRALTSWYYASTAIFWIAFAALLIALVLHWQQKRSAWLQTLVTVNLLFSTVAIGFFINKNHFEVQVKQNLGTQAVTEICGAEYVLDMDASCLSEYIYARASTLDQMASRRLAMYAALEPRHLLPASYQTGEPVIIETASIWWNLHVRDWQLANVPETAILHLYPPDPLAEVPQIPTPTLEPADLDGLREWLGKADSFWRVVTLDTPGHFNVFFDHLQEDGYAKDFTLHYNKLLVIHYRRIENSDAEPIYFGQEITLQQWSLEGDLAPCETIWLETIWATNKVPSHNYNLRVVILDDQEQEVSRADRPLGNVPTQLWQPPEWYLDERQITLPCELDAGDYDLQISVYAATDSGWLNLPASSNEGDLGEFPILTEITISG